MSRSEAAMQFGFRIVGDCRNDRRPVDWPAAFRAYAECDPQTEPERESYLSAFCFDEEFRQFLDRTGSTRGYAGPCWAPWLWFDLDAADLETATNGARRLAAIAIERFDLAGDELLVFFSGSKGFHLGLPAAVWGPEPSDRFNRYCRRFAATLAADCGVTIDRGVYDAVRALRAPNSRHPKSGRYKRFLGLDELLGLRPERIAELATEPAPFDLPRTPGPNPKAARDWAAAVATVDAELDDIQQRRAEPGRRARLNRGTRDFISNGAASGDRHRLLFSAAANLAELGCPVELACELLGEPALDSGLTPGEVRRQIECGLRHGGTR